MSGEGGGGEPGGSPRSQRKGREPQASAAHRASTSQYTARVFSAAARQLNARARSRPAATRRSRSASAVRIPRRELRAVDEHRRFAGDLLERRARERRRPACRSPSPRARAGRSPRTARSGRGRRPRDRARRAASRRRTPRAERRSRRSSAATAASFSGPATTSGRPTALAAAQRRELVLSPLDRADREHVVVRPGRRERTRGRRRSASRRHARLGPRRARRGRASCARTRSGRARRRVPRAGRLGGTRSDPFSPSARAAARTRGRGR